MRKVDELRTSFAPAERTPLDEISVKANMVKKAPHVSDILNSLPDTVAILDENRQIVFANKLMLGILKLEEQTPVLGKRPGEAFACKNAVYDTACSGCGTTEYCSQCGAVNAILDANLFKDEIRECKIITHEGDALDLLITTRKILIDGSEYTLFIAKDIADEKRRIILERIFYHDVSNLAGVLHTISDLLNDSATDEEQAEYKGIIYETSRALVEEIQSQRLISLAESKELVVKIDTLDSRSIIDEVVLIYANHNVAYGKEVIVSPDSVNIPFKTDKIVLRRILGNMLKNALEAIDMNEKVTIGCHKKDNNVSFFVQNDGYLAKEVQLQLFLRSFSTKGEGRGLGTYSIKLLAEKYLKGKVYFKTSQEEGTTFFVDLPI